MKNKMKNKIFLASSFFALALLCPPPADGQLPRANPRQPAPETGKPKPTGTVTGGTQNVINSKLLIYTKNGLGTTSTNLGGEFPSQLAASATVDNQFFLHWSRSKPGKAEKGMVYIRRAGSPATSEVYISNLSPIIPAQSITVNIGIVMPSYAADTYEIRVVGDTGSSSKVTINYTGNGSTGQPVVTLPIPTAGQPASTKTPLYITAVKFTPEVGALNEPGHKRAKLTLTLRTSTTTTISKIEIEALSEPFTNPELITSSNSKNSPIVILKGKWEVLGGGAYQILKEKENTITVILRRTSKNDVEAQESEPGLYSPGDWGRAFAQTTTASFRCNVVSPGGKLSGSFDQSPKKLWLWGAP